MLLPLWVAGFTAGIALAVEGGRWAALLVSALALALAAWRLVRRGAALGGAALAVACGVGWTLRALPPPGEPADEDRPRRILGTVLRGPDLLDPKEGRVRLWLSLSSLDRHPATGTLALSAARDSVAGVAPGDVVTFRAVPRVPLGLANPGLPDARFAAAAQGVDFYAGLSPRERVHRERAGPALAPRRLAWGLRQALDRAVGQRLDGPPAALLRTVVLGERADVDPRVEDGFRAAGATHVLSVSGLHLAAVAALIFFAIRRIVGALPALALRVTPARLAAAVAMPAVWLYALLTGEAVATMRSAFMAAAALGATMAGQRLSLASAVAAAALVLLVERPLLVLDVSFQLSFASVVALGLFAAKLAPAAAGEGAPRWRRALVWLGRFGAATGAAGLVTAPLVAHHFGEVTPVAPVGNLALVPIVEMGLLPLGLGGALLGALHPALGAPPLWLAGWVSRLALGAAEIFRRVAPVLLVRSPNPGETAALVIAAVALLAGWGRLLGRRRSWWWAAGLAVSLAAASLLARDLLRRTSDTLRVTFLDVGQGDAAVLEGPRGYVAVIDGGGAYDDSFDTGARVVEPFLRAQGIRRVDLVVLSHPHPDHLNGLLRVLQRFPVGALWTTGDDGRNPRYGELRDLARLRGVPAPAPALVAHRGLTLTPLGPWLDDRIAAPPGLDVNDASLVVRVTYAGRALLFPGDIEESGEGELLGRAALGLPVRSDVLKVPHHGSSTSSTVELLDAVAPHLAVMSLGRHNHFHFPRPEILARFSARGIRVLRTDLMGAVTVTIDRAGTLSVSCVRGCP